MMAVVTVTEEVIIDLLAEIETVLEHTELSVARNLLLGIRMSLRSLLKEARRNGCDACDAID